MAQGISNNAAIVTLLEDEAAYSRIGGVSISTKFGRNPNVGTATVPEDLTAAGGVYTGFDATDGENIEVLSSSAADSGSVVSTGTVTGGTTTTLEDESADFVSDGVAVNDVVVNDTQSAHGIVTGITATMLTVWNMNQINQNRQVRNDAGDSYRVVTPDSTGASLVRLSLIDDDNYVEVAPRYVVLNGTTGVETVGSFIRQSRIEVIAAGSGEANAGDITSRQATTTANVFAVAPAGFGQSLVGAFTVPLKKRCRLRRLRIGLTRTTGAAGSATVSVRARRRGEVFRAIRVFETQTGAPVEFTQLGGDLFTAGTDIKITIDDVSDNNSVFDGAIEYELRDER